MSHDAYSWIEKAECGKCGVSSTKKPEMPSIRITATCTAKLKVSAQHETLTLWPLMQLGDREIQLLLVAQDLNPTNIWFALTLPVGPFRLMQKVTMSLLNASCRLLDKALHTSPLRLTTLCLTHKQRKGTFYVDILIVGFRAFHTLRTRSNVRHQWVLLAKELTLDISLKEPRLRRTISMMSASFFTPPFLQFSATMWFKNTLAN